MGVLGKAKEAVYGLRTGVWLGLGLLASPAFGWMIGNLPASVLPPQSCRVEMRYAPVPLEDGRYLTESVTCSATIVGRSVLVGAAHCFAGREFEKGFAYCPGEAPIPLSSWTYPESYPTDEAAQNSVAGKDDVAVIRLSGEVKATPARFPRGPEEVEKIFAATERGLPPECQVFGYGLNEKGVTGEHNGRTVVFQKWKTGSITYTTTDRRTGRVLSEKTEPVLEWWDKNDQALVFRADKWKEAGDQLAAIQQGDSGGGLLCPDGEGGWVLMGVTRGYSQRTDAAEREQHVGVSISLAHRRALLKDLVTRAEGTRTGRPLAAEVQATVPRPRGAHE